MYIYHFNNLMTVAVQHISLSSMKLHNLYAFATWQYRQRPYFQAVLFVHSSGQILLPRYLMNGLNS